MTRQTALAAVALTLLGACAAQQTAPQERARAAAPEPTSLVVRTETDSQGRCWALEPIPAIYEQVPGQVQVVQAEIAEDGTVIRPAVWRNATVPRVVRPRSSYRFETPCPAAMTAEWRASLQRALTARGLYDGPVTGEFDAGTRAAIRRYQSARGLESDRVSLETARSLGLIAVPRPAEGETGDAAAG